MIVRKEFVSYQRNIDSKSPSEVTSDTSSLSTFFLPQPKKYVLERCANRKLLIYGTGTVVDNCNPFTLGHRYLISQAASQVKHLFVFVVEEDKSFFPFSNNDR